ncbi:hypothetical protein DV736_g3716, partial [Chaetothyriales sp. CBS 134916]
MIDRLFHSGLHVIISTIYGVFNPLLTFTSIDLPQFGIKIGKYMRRTADETQVTASLSLLHFQPGAPLPSPTTAATVATTTALIGHAQMIESSRAWCEACLVVTHQHRMLIEFDTIYKPIVTARLKDECEELKADLTTELAQVDSHIVQPVQLARDPSRVDAATKKSKRSDRDRSALAQAQADPAILPPLLVAAFSLQPSDLDLEQPAGPLLHRHPQLPYCTHESFANPSPPMDEAIRTWSDVFKPLQSELQLEREIGHLNGVRTCTSFCLAARALPLSPNFDIGLKPKLFSATLFTAVPQQPSSQGESAASTVYATPLTTPLSSSSASAPNADYFSARVRQDSATPNHGISSVALSPAIAVKKKPPPYRC